MQLRNEPAEILARLDALRASDAPTSGGRLLSYVYDPGVAELTDLAGAAALRAQSLNGLDPTTFPSIAVMERDLVALGRDVLAGGDPDVVGSVTSGGTESCMLAVKSARDVWRARTGAEHRPTLLVGATAHAAFHKAAHHLDLKLHVLPVDPVTARVAPRRRRGRPVARHRPGGRERAVVRARRPGSDRADRRDVFRPRRRSARRRLHRRLGAALVARPGGPPLGSHGAGGVEPVGGSAQVRVRAEGCVAVAVPRP